MRISDWSSDVCSSDLRCRICRPTASPDRHRSRWRCRLRHTMPQGRSGWSEKRPCRFPWMLAVKAAARAKGAHPRDDHPQFFASNYEAENFRSLIASELLTVPPTRLLRSEEHTSELQSLMRISYAVFCLKKKKKKH